MALEGRLRIGVLSDGDVLQRWQVDALEHLRALPGVDLVVWIAPPANGAHAAPGPKGRSQAWRTFLYRRYRSRLFRPAAMQEMDVRERFGDLPRLACAPQAEGVRTRFLPEDLAAIGAYAPDVLLRFGYGILDGDILDLPTHGVWSFHHGDEMKYRGGPPGLWEIMNGDPLTGAVLQRLTRKLDGGHILKKGWFATVDHSLAETVDTVLSHTSIWPAQVCRALLDGDTEAAVGQQSTTEAPLYRYPRNLEFLRFLRIQARNKLRFHRTQINVHEEWNIGILYAPITSLLDEQPNLNVRWLPAPGKGFYRADPFGYVAADGRLNVLYEKMDHQRGRAEISRLRPKRDNVLKRSRTMLEDDTHLSYPFVLPHEGRVLVVPESCAKGRVEMFQLNAANDGFEAVGTLLEEPVVDPTLFQHEGRWWLFGTLPPLSNVALHAWYADRPEGPYRPHAMNPLKFDLRSARPGGTPFVHQGRLYRPSQDSTLTYGHRIVINEVLELSPTTFREVLVKHIGPIKGSVYDKGMHTISAVGEITLVDGKRFISDKDQRARVRAGKLRSLKGRRS